LASIITFQLYAPVSATMLPFTMFTVLVYYPWMLTLLN